MRKKIVVAGVFVVVIVALLAGFHSYSLQRGIVINAPIFDVSPQFTSIKNWKNWYSSLSGSNNAITFSSESNDKIQSAFSGGDFTYKLTVLNPASVIADITNNDKTRSLYFSAMPDSNGKVTYVQLTEKRNGFDWLKNKVFGKEDAYSELKNLKSFMEDESKRYGYPITIEPVADTLILTKKATVAEDKVKATVGLLYMQLQQYMHSVDMRAAKNYHYISIVSLENKQAVVAVGIPVNKETIKREGFDFLKLPPNGRLLVGRYGGTYGEIKQLHLAMDKYVMNNRLKKVAQYLEKHRNKDIELSDSSTATVEVDYPIY